jgi:alkyl sulfatase BDS1-like metallo-beta-lactamase superfamily hydrolase
MCKCNHTSERSDELAESLQKEKDNAVKGFLTKTDPSIEGVFNIDPYYSMLCQYQATPPDTVHENLWEQGKLNMNYGLFRVNRNSTNSLTCGIGGKYPIQRGDVFQIRGHDLANMTILYTGSGWIVMDVLTSTETANYAWTNLVRAYLDENARIVGVIYSHSHIDHYAGIGGLIDFFYSPDIPILAPEGFTKHVVSENIYVGTAMKRRAVYQYGNILDVSPTGQVDAGLGKAVSSGVNTLLVPTEEIGFAQYEKGKNFCLRTIGGIDLLLQFTPDTEAPAEMNVYLPDHKVLFIAENCAGTLHNLLTPRGAQVRDALAWAGFLDQTLVTFDEIDCVCSAHNWPHWKLQDDKDDKDGSNAATRFIEIQRDLYRYIHNATLHLVNLGYTIDEVGRMLSGEGEDSLPIPKAFADEWCCHGFYGTFNHDAKAVYQRYIGWYDGNPAHLNKHKPVDRANRYVDAFGAVAIARKAYKAKKAGDYAWAAELYDYILNADTGKVSPKIIVNAKKNYAFVLTQMGYQSEAATWRNMYLTGAKEVELIPSPETEPKYLKFNDDTINAMTLEMILQYFGIMFNGSAYDADNQPDTIMTFEITADNEIISESATAKAARGVLDYRIQNSASARSSANDSEYKFVFSGSKVNVFLAFAEHNTDTLKEILKSGSYNDAILFITSYFTRFRMDFPIMTPRPQRNTKLLTQITIYWGAIVDFLQVTFAPEDTRSAGSAWTLPHKLEIDLKNDPVVKVTGVSSVSYAGKTAISRLTFYTKSGKKFDPCDGWDNGDAFTLEQPGYIINGFFGAFATGGRRSPSNEPDQFLTQFGVYFATEAAPANLTASLPVGKEYDTNHKFDFNPQK